MAKQKPKLLQIDPEMDRQQFVVDFLERFGWTQQQLADAVGVHYSAVFLWVKGKRKPNPATIMVMQELLRRNREAANA